MVTSQSSRHVIYFPSCVRLPPIFKPLLCVRTQKRTQTQPTEKSLQDILTVKGLNIRQSRDFFFFPKFFECPGENSSFSVVLALVQLLVPVQDQ